MSNSKKKNLKTPAKEIYQSQNHQSQKPDKLPSWAIMRGILSCKQLQYGQVRQQQQPKLQQQKHLLQEKQQQKQRRQKEKQKQATEETGKKCKKMKCSGSICSNTKIVHRAETSSPEVRKKRALVASSNSEMSSGRSMRTPLQEANRVVSTPPSSLSSSFNSSLGGSFKGIPFRRLSGCYECRMVVDPVLGLARDPSLKGSICTCPECGEIFTKAENLELHQALRHAVSELGPEDTSKNIVEIIFQSSWLKKQTPICMIDRILKVHNTQRTITKFEEYRDFIKSKATKLHKKHPRCIADGNELLRFHCTTFTCSLGVNGSSNLCHLIPQCNVCNIIKNGFMVATEDIPGKGILTTATSGKAHDKADLVPDDGNEKRAMLVCRVIAGRVKKNMEGSMEDYDSMAGAAGVYSNLDELYVFNSKAILPCFVVVYRGF